MLSIRAVQFCKRLEKKILREVRTLHRVKQQIGVIDKNLIAKLISE